MPLHGCICYGMDSMTTHTSVGFCGAGIVIALAEASTAAMWLAQYTEASASDLLPSMTWQQCRNVGAVIITSVDDVARSSALSSPLFIDVVFTIVANRSLGATPSIIGMGVHGTGGVAH
jgi:hypothetical protein